MSSDSRWTPRRAERAWLWLAVAALHGLLLFALRDALLPTWRGALPANGTPLAVRLIRLPPLPLARPVERAKPPARAPVLRAVASPPPTLQTTPLPLAPQAVGQAITASPIAAAMPASAPASRPLDLRAPRALAVPARPTLRDQMLNDPRSNSPTVTVESRIAAVAGSVDMSSEWMDDTRMRVRQRGKCIEVHVSRDAQLDPYNQSVAPTPKAIKPSC